MKRAKWLLGMALLLTAVAWGQGGSTDAPKSRKTHTASVHKMPPHAARQLSVREKQEHAQIRAEQRRQAKLAKKQRKDAMKRSRHLHKAQLKTQ
jgi:hypothetical protein